MKNNNRTSSYSPDTDLLGPPPDGSERDINTHLATYTGKIHSADFKENTITFEVEGNFSVVAGNYYIFSEKDLQGLVNRTCEMQKHYCKTFYEEQTIAEYDPRVCVGILNAKEPEIKEL